MGRQTKMRAAMLREGAPMAGEMSGHIFFAQDFYGFDDAQYAAVRLIRAVSELGGSLTALRDAMQYLLNRAQIAKSGSIAPAVTPFVRHGGTGPSELAVHGGSGVRSGLIERLRATRPQAPFLELVHRLDRETTGCLVLGRNKAALKRLGAMFADGRIKKTYCAIVCGAPKDDAGRIDLPLARRSHDKRSWWMKVDPAGDPSFTRYRVLDHAALQAMLDRPLALGAAEQAAVLVASSPLPVDVLVNCAGGVCGQQDVLNGAAQRYESFSIANFALSVPVVRGDRVGRSACGGVLQPNDGQHQKGCALRFFARLGHLFGCGMGVTLQQGPGKTLAQPRALGFGQHHEAPRQELLVVGRGSGGDPGGPATAADTTMQPKLCPIRWKRTSILHFEIRLDCWIRPQTFSLNCLTESPVIHSRCL